MNVRALSVMSLTPREGDVCRKHRAAGGGFSGYTQPFCGPEAGSDLSVAQLAHAVPGRMDPRTPLFLSSGLNFKRYFLAKRLSLSGVRWESHNIKQAGSLVMYLKRD